MDAIWLVLPDIVAILFFCCFCARLIPLREAPFRWSVVIGIGIATFLSGYLFAVIAMQWTRSAACALLVLLPAFLLFGYASKHWDGRLLMTFFMVANVELALETLGRFFGFLFPSAPVMTTVGTLALNIAVIALVRPAVKELRGLMFQTAEKWDAMTLSAGAGCFAMVLLEGRPDVNNNQPGELLTWFMVAVLVLLSDVVFLQSMLKTARISAQNRELKEKQKFADMAYTDALTGIPNRAAWLEHVNHLERIRGQTPVCCIMVDCDGFKQINDTYGHKAGDDLLRRVANVLKEAFAEDGDRIFRLGGDEFCILISDGTPERIARCVRQMDIQLMQGCANGGIPISVSHGVALAEPAELIETVVDRADREMYAAKNRRRGRMNPPGPAPQV